MTPKKKLAVQLEIPKTKKKARGSADKAVKSGAEKSTLPETNFPIVGIGASAGGLEALDITDRKQAEAKIKFQANLLEAIGEAIIATDMAGTVIYFNPAAEELYAYPATEAMGRNIMDVNVPDLSQAEAVEIMKQLKAGKTWSGEFMVQRRDGTVFPALVSDSPGGGGGCQ